MTWHRDVGVGVQCGPLVCCGLSEADGDGQWLLGTGGAGRC